MVGMSESDIAKVHSKAYKNWNIILVLEAVTVQSFPLDYLHYSFLSFITFLLHNPLCMVTQMFSIPSDYSFQIFTDSYHEPSGCLKPSYKYIFSAPHIFTF